MMIRILALVLLVSLPVTSEATTYYVSTTGSDSNAGTSETTPFLTIEHCATLLTAGNTCYVRGGTYNEAGVRFRYSGTSSAPIRLLNYPNESPIINWTGTTSNHRILIQNTLGYNKEMGWITIEGFEIRNGYEGIKYHNLHNSTIQHNWIHDNLNQGMVGHGAHHVLINRNIINHNGPFIINPTSNLAHGIYMSGPYTTITNNLIYDNIAYGITQNGSASSVYDPVKHAGPEFAGAQNWIIANNTFAFNRNRGGIVIWGTLTANARIENNIFYENSVNVSSAVQAVEFCCSNGSGSTGIQILNNHSYASGSGGTAFIGGQTSGYSYTSTGNVINVSPPAFVDAGGDTIPASRDFRLTASAPVNIALANEFPNNSTAVVGAFKTVAGPACSITTNVINCIFPMGTAVPIHNLSTSGVTIGCTLSNCPGGGLTASTVSRPVQTDTHVAITVAGFTADACVATNQDITLSYASATGTWTGNDHIGPYPGLHQKIFSVTNLAVTNNCTGSSPSGYPAGYQLFYKFNENTGTNANDESANNLDGTLTNSPTWGAGKTGYGVVMAGNNTQHVAVPYGNAVDPSSQSLTIAFGVNISEGNQSLARQYIGSPLGTDKRLYVSTNVGTWRLGIQASNDATASELAVHSGWNHVCLTMDSATDTATLHLDGVASTSAGARKTYTSYALAGDFDLGRIADQAAGGGGGTYDDFLIYPSVQNCNTIYTAFQGTPSAPVGTLAQAAVQFQGVYLDVTSNVISFGVSTKEVVANGGVAVVFQIHCQNIADCDPTAFKLMYAKDQTAAAARAAGTALHVPNTETSDGIWMWGSSDAGMNTGVTTTRLTGTCAVTNGATQVTAEQIPSVDLPQDGCVMLRYIVRVGNVAGSYFELFLVTESGLVLAGGYVDGRVTVVNPRASGIGF